jgi:hypothetical protein
VLHAGPVKAPAAHNAAFAALFACDMPWFAVFTPPWAKTLLSIASGPKINALAINIDNRKLYFLLFTILL